MHKTACVMTLHLFCINTNFQDQICELKKPIRIPGFIT